MGYSKNLKQRNNKIYISDINYTLHNQILEVIMENGFLIKENNWNDEQMEIRAAYDSFRILNLVSDHLNNA